MESNGDHAEALFVELFMSGMKHAMKEKYIQMNELIGGYVCIISLQKT